MADAITMVSADFSRLTFFDQIALYGTPELSVRPPRVRDLSFLFYSSDFLYRVTHIFWILTFYVVLSVCTSFVSDFCSSSQYFGTRFLWLLHHGKHLSLL